ncbi:MAG: acyl-CoA dehydrogenase family protein [Frankiaceae bacterium]
MSPDQIEVQLRFGELVSDELAPVIARTGERPRDRDPAESAEARAVVHAALTGLGATRLLLPARYGGEGRGQQHAVLLAELLGTALYRGPLLDTWTATELLAAEEGHEKLLAQIAEGHAVALALRESGADEPDEPPRAEVASGAVTATRRFVDLSGEVAHLLVAGRTPAGVEGLVVRADHPSVNRRRQGDITRGELHEVRLAGTPLVARTEWAPALPAARIRHAAYLVGLCQGALDAAVARAGERHQFGQPIGRFQSIAFSLAEVATRLEGARWLVRGAAWDADQGIDVRLVALQSLAMASDLVAGATALALQTFGAAGLTEECDAQLFFRRGALERAWLGSPAQLRARAVPLLAARVSAAAAGPHRWSQLS